MFALFYCLHAPHFPAASMRQFYCRAQRRSEPSGETAGTVGGGEGLMKMELNAYAVTEIKRRVSGLDRSGIYAWQRSERRCGDGGTKTKRQENHLNGERGEETRDNCQRRRTEERGSERKRTLVRDRGAGGGRGSGTTNQVDCLITSCIPHSSPILLNNPPSPRQQPHPRSLAPSASPWQPDRVPNT